MSQKIDTKEQISQIGAVVNEAGRIENILDEIIIEYYWPDANKHYLFRRSVLNSAIMSFSAKVKVVSAIVKHEKWGKFDQTPFYKIMNIRNAFAHNDVDTKARFDIFTLEGPEWVLSSIKNDGTYQERNRKEAFDEFLENINLAKKQLIEIYKKAENT